MGRSGASKPICPSDTNSQNATIAIFVIVGICISYQFLNGYLLLSSKPNNALKNLASFNLLSGLLASGTAILFTYTKWPQPLTDAGLLTVLFALINVLGWNKYLLRQPARPQDTARQIVQEPRLKERLMEASEKIPDVAALAVTSFTLWIVQGDYTERTENSFWPQHAPTTYGICAIVVFVVGAVLGCLAVAFERDSNHRNWYTIALLLLDILVGLGFGIYAIYMVVVDQFCGRYLAAGVLIGCALIVGAIVAIISMGVYIRRRTPQTYQRVEGA